MTAAQMRALDLFLSSQVTNDPVDQARAVLALRASNNDPAVLAMILERRRMWLTWLTLTQRRWQQKPRTITDSDIERRVRCRQPALLTYTVERAPAPAQVWAGEALHLIEGVQTRERYVRCV